MQAEMDKVGQGYLLQKNAANAGLWCSSCYEFYNILSQSSVLSNELINLAVALVGILSQVRGLLTVHTI